MSSLHVWTPFNKLGRIYGKEIRERAKKSASSFVHKIREIGTTIYPWLLWQVSLPTAKPATTSPSYLADFLKMWRFCKALRPKEFIIKMEGNTGELSDISGSEIHGGRCVQSIR